MSQAPALDAPGGVLDEVGAVPPVPGPSSTHRLWHVLRRNRPAVLSLVFVAFVVLVALFAPLIAPQDPNAQDLGQRLKGPSGAHWLGTDQFGRDVLSRLVMATRLSILAVVQALAVAALLGVPAGLAAGFLGRFVDAILNPIADALLSVPPLMLALAVVGVLGRGLTFAMVAVGLILAPRFFRVARGAAQSVRNETYVEACRLLGCSSWRLLWRHALPNASSPLLVQVTFGASIVIVAEASLSFLGVGVQIPDATWGSMLQDAYRSAQESVMFGLPAAVMIVLTILSFSTLGDGLRDALEGRATGRS